MVRFIEFHSADKKNKSFFVNIEDISMIHNESNENYNVTDIILRNGNIYRIAETKEEIVHMLNHIR